MERAGLFPIRRLRVESRSKKGKFYIVEVFKNGKYECTCPAGTFKNFCKHKKKIAEFLDEI